MPKINVRVTHELEPSVAVERLKSFSTKFKAQFGSQISKIDETWQEDSMAFAITARGINIAGNVVVNSQSIEVVSNLPFAALPFRGLIETHIRNAIADAIADSTA